MPTTLTAITPSTAASDTLSEFDFDAQLSLLSALELRQVELDLPPVEQLCAWCVEHGPKGCPACTQRRRAALRRLDDGASIEEIAAELDINVERVERLLEQHDDRREVEALRVSQIDNAELRAAFERWHAQDPRAHSAAELARRSGLSCSSHVERELGLLKTTDSTKHGVVYPGRIKTTTSVSNAEKILRGLGYDPNDVERLIAGEKL